jgi:histidyl-tRNA synthetase
MALSTKPYKGARDFYPEDKRLQKYMFNKIREVVERYGYEEYDAPILESLDIYLAKTGEEIVSQQTYTFEDRGGRKVAIRPEMTPTVSRMVAAKRQELIYPLRWYSIPNLWRYERPQRGRLREHWQLNVDIFGIGGVQAEAEVITLVDDLYRSFGATESMYEIRINDRRLVNYVFDKYLELDAEQAQQLGKLVDRMEKMDRSKFISEADSIATSAQREAGFTEKLLAFLEAKNVTDLKFLDDKDAVGGLETLIAQLKAVGINNAVFDPKIMRGFDYYTGIVFEVFDLNPDNNRAMMGGGRYDGLVGLFGVDPVPTVGFGLGDVTLQNFLETNHLLPELKPEADAIVVLIGNVTNSAQPLISQLRGQGLNLAVDLSNKKLGDQLKSAGKRGIKYALIIGEDEIQAQRVNVKNLQDGSAEKLSLDEVSNRLKQA